MTANDVVSSYAVDVVFCVDVTGSMSPYLDSVKSTARQFHQLLSDKMAEKSKGIRQLRVRIVAFRDLGADGPDAISGTKFYTLPEESSAFDSYVAGLRAGGGGDEPESALEGLAVAIRSEWERGLDKRRHVIVVCTDASSHPLGKFAMTAPAGQKGTIPRSFDDLQRMWGDETDEGEMEYAAKRLVVFAPKSFPWSDINERLENCIYVESAAGHGMADADQVTVLDQIAGSV